MEKENHVYISIRLTETDRKKLAKYAEANSSTTNRIINMLVKEFLKDKNL